MPTFTDPPELFASDDDVVALEVALVDASGPQLALLRTHLAWHLRQRDRARARALGLQIEADLGSALPADAQTERCRARLALVRAEDLWLDGELDAAQTQINEAMELFTRHGDFAGVGDACWLATTVRRQQGTSELTVTKSASAAYAQCADARRVALLTLRRCFHDAFVDVEAARERLRASGLERLGDPHGSVRTWLNAAQASILAHGDADARSLAFYEKAHEAAMVTGQWRMGSVFASNIGVCHRNLNDLVRSLEWQERALNVACQLGSPHLQGMCRSQLGMLLSELDLHEAAMAMLLDADKLLADDSIPKAYNCQGLGEVHLGQQDWRGAIPWLETARIRCEALNRQFSLNSTLLDLATAHLGLGDLEKALNLSQQALAHAQEYPKRVNVAIAHHLIARVIRAGRGVEANPSPTTQDALWHLQEAQKVSSDIPDQLIDPKLLDDLAAEHARLGNLAAAYEASVQARDVREAHLGKKARAMAATAQVRFETDDLRNQRDLSQRLRESEARRADALVQANNTLEQLGGVGRDITACTNDDAIFAALDRHLHQMLTLKALAVFLIDGDGLALNLAFGQDTGQTMAPRRVALNDPHHVVARCARDHADQSQAGGPLDGPAIDLSKSRLDVPLRANNTLLGVLSVQSSDHVGFGERERSILQTVGAYVSIALANSVALATLRKAQEQLAHANEELATLATTDPLTGLANRRQLDRVLAHEFAAARRYGSVFSLILMDIDHFKRINDTHSHLAGDRVLALVGQLLNERRRLTDTAGRWGGEEFLLICPGATLAEAQATAESMRALIEALVLPGIGHCTVSLGVTRHQAEDSVQTLLSRVDRALYAAKSGGRNQVVKA